MVQRVFLLHDKLTQSPIELPPEEAHHLIHVLRMQNGEQVQALNGSGSSCLGKLQISKQKIFFHPLQEPIQLEKSKALVPLTLALGILKASAMEWVIEKSLELGIESLQPLLSDHSVVQTQKKGSGFFQERWQKIADQSLKQCGRMFRMEVKMPASLDSFLNTSSTQDSMICCDELAASQTEAKDIEHIGLAVKKIHSSKQKNHTFILVGPEGGWSSRERTLLEQRQVLRVHLGSFILRADTAAIYSASISSFLIQNS